MQSNPRYYTPLTIKRLFALSGNRCAFPGCTKEIVNSNNAMGSNICHIEGAKVGSERYNPLMTNKERADYSNLILLCNQHHGETNNVDTYSVDVLRNMKREHESDLFNQKIMKNPSMLKNTINAIAGINFNDFQEIENLTVFDPKNKINFNSIRRNVALIEEYKVYHEKINSLYDELELQGSIKKERLLNNIKQIYIHIKGKYILDSDNPIEVIKQNSDNIIDDVYDALYSKMEESGFWDEDIVFGIRLIMVDAFMRCKILEEPQTNDSK